MRGEVEPAELQELAIVIEAAQVPGLGEDGQRMDRTDAWNLTKLLEVLVIADTLQRFGFDSIAMLNELAHLQEDQAEHGDCRGLASLHIS